MGTHEGSPVTGGDYDDLDPVVDPYANLEVCPACDEWVCLPCDLHWSDCPCPGIGGEDPAMDAAP